MAKAVSNTARIVWDSATNAAIRKAASPFASPNARSHGASFRTSVLRFRRSAHARMQKHGGEQALSRAAHYRGEEQRQPRPSVRIGFELAGQIHQQFTPDTCLQVQDLPERVRSSACKRRGTSDQAWRLFLGGIGRRGIGAKVSQIGEQFPCELVALGGTLPQALLDDSVDLRRRPGVVLRYRRRPLRQDIRDSQGHALAAERMAAGSQIIQDRAGNNRCFALRGKL
jgi:hypothetical protein